ncbi:hypothetical protein CR513_07596, partial [Mucuna pruriens]
MALNLSISHSKDSFNKTGLSMRPLITLRFQVNIPIFLWGECILATTYIINRISTIANKGVTPYEVLFGTLASYDHLESFMKIFSLCFTRWGHDNISFHDYFPLRKSSKRKQYGGLEG